MKPSKTNFCKWLEDTCVGAKSAQTYSNSLDSAAFKAYLASKLPRYNSIFECTSLKDLKTLYNGLKENAPLAAAAAKYGYVERGADSSLLLADPGQE